MKLSSFDYYLPKNLIAQKPVFPRDHSRLLILDKKSDKILHRYFYNLPEFLKKGDVLVLNNTKVFPARLFGKKETGGKVEVLLLKKYKENIWQAIGRIKNLKIGTKIIFESDLIGEIVNKNNREVFEIKFNQSGKKFWEIINQIGLTPLPPYIKKFQNLESEAKNLYQTCYAKHIGSVAAPTAGFHFTPLLLKRIKKQGVQIEFITLHIGLGTFLPVREKEIEKHKVSPEFVIINQRTVENLNKAKSEGRRIIACGTTVCRALEAAVFKEEKNKNCFSYFKIKPLRKEIDLFIYPGYKFKFIDALITNFHLPKTTLLMLVCAFASKEKIFKAYKEAINKKYRFYSFGDAMLIK